METPAISRNRIHAQQFPPRHCAAHPANSPTTVSFRSSGVRQLSPTALPSLCLRTGQSVKHADSLPAQTRCRAESRTARSSTQLLSTPEPIVSYIRGWYRELRVTSSPAAERRKSLRSAPQLLRYAP